MSCTGLLNCIFRWISIVRTDFVFLLLTGLIVRKWTLHTYYGLFIQLIIHTEPRSPLICPIPVLRLASPGLSCIKITVFIPAILFGVVVADTQIGSEPFPVIPKIRTSFVRNIIGYSQTVWDIATDKIFLWFNDKIQNTEIAWRIIFGTGLIDYLHLLHFRSTIGFQKVHQLFRRNLFQSSVYHDLHLPFSQYGNTIPVLNDPRDIPQ